MHDIFCFGPAFMLQKTYSNSPVLERQQAARFVPAHSGGVAGCQRLTPSYEKNPPSRIWRGTSSCFSVLAVEQTARRITFQGNPAVASMLEEQGVAVDWERPVHARDSWRNDGWW